MLVADQANEIRVRAPQGLVDLLAGAAFDVELVISRAAGSSLDPDTEVPGADEEFSDQDMQHIEALTAAFEASTPEDDPDQRAQPTAPLAGSASPAADERRDASSQLLSQTTITLKTLEANALTAHWRVRGANFIQVHEFLGRYVKALRKYADQTAERCAAAGGQAPAVPAGGEMPTDAIEICQKLLAMTTDTIRSLGKARVQATAESMLDTVDLLTQIMRGLEEKWGWWLAASVEGSEVTDAGAQEPAPDSAQQKPAK